jgi:cytoskeletal protein CcmA (bactofilin family)
MVIHLLAQHHPQSDRGNQERDSVAIMWNKKNEEETGPKVLSQPSGFAAPTAVRSAPVPVTPEQPKAPNRGASIGPSMTVKGEVSSREELFVDGEIEGSIEMHHRLTVGPNGKVRATVKAKEVVIEGSIHGNVTAAEKIIIRVQGSLVGDIKTAGIVIEDGAYFKGNIDITRPETKQRAPSESTNAQAREMVSVRP